MYPGGNMYLHYLVWSLMPLDLCASLCVNMIVLLKNKCFTYKWPSPVSQHGHDGCSKRRNYLHKNKITIISG